MPQNTPINPDNLRPVWKDPHGNWICICIQTGQFYLQVNFGAINYIALLSVSETVRQNITTAHHPETQRLIEAAAMVAQHTRPYAKHPSSGMLHGGGAPSDVGEFSDDDEESVFSEDDSGEETEMSVDDDPAETDGLVDEMSFYDTAKEKDDAADGKLSKKEVSSALSRASFFTTTRSGRKRTPVKRFQPGGNPRNGQFARLPMPT